MVTTGQDNIELVTGNYQVDKENLTPDEWHAIIHATTETLTVEYLKGLVSIQQILSWDRNCVPCQIDHSLVMDDGLNRANMIECATLESLPHKWEDWPRIDGEAQAFDSAKESMLVFQRGRDGKSQFAILTVTWQILDTTSQDLDRRLNAVNISMENRVQINELFVRSKYPSNLGELILGTLSRAQRETAQELNRRAGAAAKAASILEGFRSRMK